MFFGMLELIYSPFILLLIRNEYSFSENRRSDSSLSSSANASTNESFLFYNHHNSSLRGYYEEGKQGPCGMNMVLFPINGTRYGECDCAMTSARLLIYHNETNRCYPIYHQGYCKSGEQLVLKREGSLVLPKCRRTLCYEALKNPVTSGRDLVPFNNTCVEVCSRCSDGPGHSIGFQRENGLYDARPACLPGFAYCRSRSIGAPSIGCSPGTYRASSGHCQPPIYSFDDWD